MADSFPPSPRPQSAGAASHSSELSAAAVNSFSWWIWQPGLAPIQALLIGLPLMLLAALFFTVGLYTLIFGIIDGVSPPMQVSSVTTAYTSSSLDNLPRLTIRLDRPGGAKEITDRRFSRDEQGQGPFGDGVTLDYSQHLHALYALEDGGRRYDLPGGSATGNLQARSSCC